MALTAPALRAASRLLQQSRGRTAWRLRGGRQTTTADEPAGSDAARDPLGRSQLRHSQKRTSAWSPLQCSSAASRRSKGAWSAEGQTYVKRFDRYWRLFPRRSAAPLCLRRSGSICIACQCNANGHRRLPPVDRGFLVVRPEPTMPAGCLSAATWRSSDARMTACRQTTSTVRDSLSR